MNLETGEISRQTKSGSKPLTGGLLQRKCACGQHKPGGGSCAKCAGKEKPLGLQTKLRIGEPGDRFEQEADRVADRVVGMTNPSGTAPAGRENLSQGNALVQRRANFDGGGMTQAPSIVHDVLRSPGRPLDPATRNYMEPRFGQDFSQVRVHTGSRAAESADSVGASAYTVGRNIVFGGGHYSPGTNGGQKLLAHELTHTLQQGSMPTSNTQGLKIMPENSVSEREADSLAQRVLQSPVGNSAGQNAPSTESGLARRVNSRLGHGVPFLQMKKRGAAGGCGICMNDPGGRKAGQIAHTEIQGVFMAMNPDIHPERRVPVVAGDETPPFSPSLDLALVEEDKLLGRIIYIGEIKPLDDAKRQATLGRKQLQDYTRELRFSYDEVFRMRIPVPPIPIPFINPMNPPGCPPQKLIVQLTEPGLYQYYCEPPWSDLKKIPACNKCGKKRDEEKERVREPDVPIVVSPDLRKQPPNTIRPPQGIRPPESVPDVEPKPTPKPEIPEVEQPHRPPPETPLPAPANDNVEVEAPETEIELPIAARELLDVAALTALLTGLAYGASKLAGKLKNRALIHAQALALIAVVILYSDRVEASTGSDESPLEALFKAMSEDGIPVPKELQERIKGDEELKSLLEEAASGADMTEAQQELSNKMLQEIANNPDVYSNEDLKALLEVSEAASSVDGSAEFRAENLKNMIETRGQGKTGGEDQGGKGEGKAGGEATGDQGGTQTEEGLGTGEGLSSISPEQREQIKGNPPVKKLLDSIVSNTGGGPKLNETSIQRFLDTVPADLTNEEAEILISQLIIIEDESQTLDKLMSKLKGAIDKLRQQPSEDTEGPQAELASPENSADEKESDSEQSVSLDELAIKVADRLNKGNYILNKIKYDPKIELKKNERIGGFTAELFKNKILIGSFITITPVKDKGNGVWEIEIETSHWFDKEKNYVRRVPEFKTTVTTR